MKKYNTYRARYVKMLCGILHNIFFSKNRQSVKLLRWDTDGFVLYHKRLERGTFDPPRRNAGNGCYELSWETFSFIMSGVSLESVRFRKRYRVRFVRS